ncbi:hypothetical protein ACFL6P_07180 [Candidatus Latescibacterota bacterium]
MNKRQRIALIIGMLLIILMVIFPPYRGIISGRIKVDKFIGYGLFFAPPDALNRELRDVESKEKKEEMRSALSKGGVSINTFIDYKRLSTQIILCIIITFGSIVLQYKRNDEVTNETDESINLSQETANEQERLFDNNISPPVDKELICFRTGGRVNCGQRL